MTPARCTRSRSVFALLGVVVGAILLAGSGAGCIAEGADKATFAPMMPARHDIAPITRLVVALIGGVDDDWRSGIESGLARQLDACGVRSTVLSPERLELAFLDRARRTAAQIQASAMLTIECKRSEAFEETATVTTRRALIFELMVIEPGSSKVVWRVESKLTVASHPSTSDSATAERFAASVVSQLQADRVLTGCPAPSKDQTAHATLPPCERLQREASAIADPTQPCRR